MILFTENVHLSVFDNKVLIFFMVLESIWKSFNVVPVITSGNDGTHREDSDHYKGYGWDVRTRDVPNPAKVYLALRTVLKTIDPSYKLELIETTNNKHIHVGYDTSVKFEE
jgi:hypothetical protein